MDSSQYEPPVRKSLSDEELAARVNLATTSHSGIEAVMELLVAQEALRAQEDAELEAWVEKMEADGSDQALAALAKLQGKDFVPRTDFIAVVQEAKSEAEPAEVAVEEPTVEEIEVQETIVVEPDVQEPFSWFTKPEPVEIEAEPEIVVEIEEPVAQVEVLIEEADVLSEEPALPVGSETLDEFEQLLTAASAEEELTALQDEVAVVTENLSSNVVIPSDEYRNRKPLSQLFVWFGASATVVPLLITWALIGFGLSASAIAVDLTVGFLISGLLLGFAALAGKRSGLSTATISRAVFGVWGNSVPVTLVAIARVFQSALAIAVFVLLMDGIETRLPLFDSTLFAIGSFQFTVGLGVSLAVLFVAVLIVLVPGNTSRIVQIGLSVMAFVLVTEGLLGTATTTLAFSTPGNLGVASKESLAAIALIVMVCLTLWFAIAPNLSRTIPMKYRGVKVFGSVLMAQFLLPLITALIALLWLGPATAVTAGSGKLGSLPAVVLGLPQWSRGALVSGIAISLVYITVLSLKTSSLDLLALLRLKNKVLAVVLAASLTGVVLTLFSIQPASLQVEYLANVFVLCSFLSAGWLAMMVTDVALRRIAYHELSLTRSYGYYGKFNLLSFIIWIITLVAAFALIPLNLRGAGFTGFAVSSLGLDNSIGSQAFGFVAVVLLGVILTLAVRIPQIRKQEREVLAVESRREQLNDIFIGQE